MIIFAYSVRRIRPSWKLIICQDFSKGGPAQDHGLSVCLSVCMFWMPTSLDIINLHDCNHVYVIRHIYFKLSGVWFIQHVVVWNWVCVCVCVFCSVQCYLVIGDSGHVTRALESRRSVGVNILALFYTFLYHPNVFVVLSLTTCAHSVKLIWFWVTR